MGAQLSGGRASGRSRYRPMAEINVTPFVDVMLVLLIIFMVTAPMMTAGVPIDLPQSKAGPLHEKSDPLTISINEAGEIFIQDTLVTSDQLIPRLQAMTTENKDMRIFIRGDKKVHNRAPPNAN
jgi:biopolymer transport protein TolR